MKDILLMAAIGIFCAGRGVSFAESPGAEIQADDGPSLGIIHLEHQALSLSGGPIFIELFGSCFRPNLRGVANPLSQNASVQILLNLLRGSQSIPVDIRVPGMFFISGAQSNRGLSAHIASAPRPESGTGLTGNHLLVGHDTASKYLRFLLSLATPEIPSDSTGAFDPSSYALSVRRGGVTVNQYNAIWRGEFYGENNPLPLSGTIQPQVLRGNTLRLNISVPAGEDGWAGCNGYVSPLMLFFGEDRPSFKNESEFPVRALQQLPSYWPEAGAPGYFLARDVDGDGKISQATELFGSYAHKNGFEALKPLDGNKDGVLDKRDVEFSRLLLWKDRNGNGLSEEGELGPLAAKGVVALPLNYRANRIVPFSGRAEGRERVYFSYRDAQGKKKQGEMVDIWLHPVHTYTASKTSLPKGFRIPMAPLF